VTLKTLLRVREGHRAYDFPSMFYRNYGSILRHFWGIQCRKMSWLWNPGQRSLEVIESGTIR